MGHKSIPSTQGTAGGRASCGKGVLLKLMCSAAVKRENLLVYGTKRCYFGMRLFLCEALPFRLTNMTVVVALSFSLAHRERLKKASIPWGEHELSLMENTCTYKKVWCTTAVVILRD